MEQIENSMNVRVKGVFFKLALLLPKIFYINRSGMILFSVFSAFYPKQALKSCCAIPVLAVTLFPFPVLAAQTLALDDQSSKEIHLRARNASMIYSRALQDGWARSFMTLFPKGADLHNHLTGAIYAETWLDWAAEDGLCIDPSGPAIRDPALSDPALSEEADQGPESQICKAFGWEKASDVRSDEEKRRQLLNALSLRSYVPTNGWSGHDQFFVTFSRMARKPGRLGDMYAAAAERAGQQNILYLELMETPVLPELFPLVEGVSLTGDVAADYQTLMHSDFGRALDDLTDLASKRLKEALAEKDRILKCGTPEAARGCDVYLKTLYQVVRAFDPANVFAQIILGWRVISNNPDVVGLNLVAPEDGLTALRDYTFHMQMIDHLYRREARHNVTLHAGELTLGLVRPKQLRFHIRQAIDLGHAKRIGHGISIAYETGSLALINHMRDKGIMVEINLTSNDTILGVKGRDHPLGLYRTFFVPYAFSTDDEGVSRIDLTHEYLRAATEHSLTYFELKASSRNSLAYSFLEGASLWDIESCSVIEKGGDPNQSCRQAITASEKARMQWMLEEKFRSFEAGLKLPALPKRSVF